MVTRYVELASQPSASRDAGEPSPNSADFSQCAPGRPRNPKNPAKMAELSHEPARFSDRVCPQKPRKHRPQKVTLNVAEPLVNRAFKHRRGKSC